MEKTIKRSNHITPTKRSAKKIETDGMALFQKNLLLAFRSCLPETYHTEIHTVVKNNDVNLDSLVIHTGDSEATPNFYLQDYYQRYKNGETVTAICQEIISVYERMQGECSSFQLDLSWETCKDRIVYRLVSRRKNATRLTGMPYLPFLDMAITFHVLVTQDQDGIRSLGITNQILEKWCVSTQELFCLAQENTIRLFPKKICAMEKMLEEMILQTRGSATKGISYDTYEMPATQNDMLVVTNTKGINGAASILYPGCMEELYQHLSGGFYLLPSSIHEILVVPGYPDMPLAELKQMVAEVNESCVQRDEILSDSVYYYASPEDGLTVY